MTNWITWRKATRRYLIEIKISRFDFLKAN